MENEMETVVLRERYYSSAPVSYDNYRLFCVAEDDRLKNVRRIIQSRGRDRMIFKPQQEDEYLSLIHISSRNGRATAIREMRRAFTWYWNRCTTITRP